MTGYIDRIFNGYEKSKILQPIMGKGEAGGGGMCIWGNRISLEKHSHYESQHCTMTMYQWRKQIKKSQPKNVWYFKRISLVAK